MKQRFFTIAAIAVLAIVGVFIFEHATSAQRPNRNDQNQRGNRQGGDRGGRGMGMGAIDFVSIVDNSWVDLTFAVKVDDETLVKARPVYQATREKFVTKMKEIRASGDIRAAQTEMQSFLATAGTEFQASLKEVLTADQMAKLNELTKQRQSRQAEQRQRMNRFREGRNRGGGGGGTR